MQHPFITEDIYRIDTANLVLLQQNYAALSKAEHDLLNNILQSINEKLNAQQLHCVFGVDDVESTLQNYKAGRVIVFNDEPQTELQNSADRLRIVYAGSLAELEKNKALKTTLWQGLQKLFLS
ncbi:MAG TPA: hypothetical protein PKC24_16580 [Cyclobacteriaceae bacterium]|nr:hypothetical protein [Cyclobacteriaceae bacterium]